MRLTVREAADLLGAPEAIVEDWIVKKGLPAYRMNDRLWLDRAELLEWATERGVPFSRRLYPQAGGSELGDALMLGGVHHDIDGDTPESVLSSLVERLPLPDPSEAAMLLDLLLAREAEDPTVIGDGIALPHARMPIVLGVERPLLAIAYPRAPVLFGTSRIRVLFTLVTPTPRAHLHLLARVAHALHDPEFQRAVEERADQERLLALVKDIEGAASAR